MTTSEDVINLVPLSLERCSGMCDGAMVQANPQQLFAAIFFPLALVVLQNSCCTRGNYNDRQY